MTVHKGEPGEGIQLCMGRALGDGRGDSALHGHACEAWRGLGCFCGLC